MAEPLDREARQVQRLRDLYEKYVNWPTHEADGATSIWRTGRKVGRTIYLQRGPEPSNDDTLIGVMDTPELAQQAVAASGEGKAGENRMESNERGWPTGCSATRPATIRKDVARSRSSFPPTDEAEPPGVVLSEPVRDALGCAEYALMTGDEATRLEALGLIRALLDRKGET